MRYHREPALECNGVINGFGPLNCFGLRGLVSSWEMKQLASANFQAFALCATGWIQNQNDLG
jgi:hypothetical protein